MKAEKVTVAFHGRPGAWGEAAALAVFPQDASTLPCASREEVFAAVEQGRADRGIIPIEHSLTGSDHQNYDLLLEHRLHIIGEIYFPIVHCLMANPGVNLSALRRIYSHPLALDQCRSFLGRLPGVRLQPDSDTGAAVARIKARGLMHSGAVASERAAELYGMKILARAIEDPPANVTRFLILSTENVAPKRKAKTSVVFAVKDLTRQFFSCLSLFALRDLSVTKIESRPVRKRPNHVLFYLDVAAPLSDPELAQALEQLREIAPWVRVLGCYPAAKPAA